jgi:hypothetical protein
MPRDPWCPHPVETGLKKDSPSAKYPNNLASRDFAYFRHDGKRFGRSQQDRKQRHNTLGLLGETQS